MRVITSQMRCIRIFFFAGVVSQHIRGGAGQDSLEGELSAAGDITHAEISSMHPSQRHLISTAQLLPAASQHLSPLMRRVPAARAEIESVETIVRDSLGDAGSTPHDDSSAHAAGPPHASRVWCGAHAAKTCGECSHIQGPNWCNGDCEWDEIVQDCLFRSDLLWCGAHAAPSCAECSWDGTVFRGSSWCNGECYWISGGNGSPGQCTSKYPNAPAIPKRPPPAAGAPGMPTKGGATSTLAPLEQVLQTLPPRVKRNVTTEAEGRFSPYSEGDETAGVTSNSAKAAPSERRAAARRRAETERDRQAANISKRIEALYNVSAAEKVTFSYATALRFWSFPSFRDEERQLSRTEDLAWALFICLAIFVGVVFVLQMFCLCVFADRPGESAVDRIQRLSHEIDSGSVSMRNYVVPQPEDTALVETLTKGELDAVENMKT
eukprot:TRINITY_DN40735_c0_g1_i1.p1 TRINITY_DN40735_c0_g1~~TRINITY_DN40735_c0_g1_i1.p1  ORF type:complete len:436 (+),score=71.48 TRINITY_DN40735_c0_g1_i1:180-1487(+)